MITLMSYIEIQTKQNIQLI